MIPFSTSLRLAKLQLFILLVSFCSCSDSEVMTNDPDLGMSDPVDAALQFDVGLQDASDETPDQGFISDSGEVADSGVETDAGFPVHEDAAAQKPDSGPMAVCGNLLLEGTETCDDGNLDDDDGCSSLCEIEPQCTAGCLMNSDCLTDERCIGRPSSVTGATGQCTDTSFVMGRDAPCSSTMPCGPGLVCLGEFAYMSGGWCVESWFAKDFYSHDNLAIPDNGMTVTSSVVACGLATVPVDIVVTLHLDHPRPEDLLVVLKNPSQGKRAVLLDRQAYTPGPIVARGIPGDDAVNGRWYLEVTDQVAGEAGRLLGWSVYLLSRWD